MNQYRCETCKHRWGNEKCPIKLTDIYGGANIYKELKYVIDSCGCASHSDFPLSEKLPEGWLWLRIDPETWGLINCFDKEKAPEQIIKEVLYAIASRSDPDVQELFREEIAKWKDEDPLFMSYVYGQEAGRKEGREKVIGEFKKKIMETTGIDRMGYFNPDTDYIPRLGVDELAEIIEELRKDGE